MIVAARTTGESNHDGIGSLEAHSLHVSERKSGVSVGVSGRQSVMLPNSLPSHFRATRTSDGRDPDRFRFWQKHRKRASSYGNTSQEENVWFSGSIYCIMKGK